MDASVPPQVEVQAEPGGLAGCGELPLGPGPRPAMHRPRPPWRADPRTPPAPSPRHSLRDCARTLQVPEEGRAGQEGPGHP